MNYLCVHHIYIESNAWIELKKNLKFPNIIMDRVENK